MNTKLMIDYNEQVFFMANIKKYNAQGPNGNQLTEKEFIALKKGIGIQH